MAIALEQLLIEIRLQGQAQTKQQMQDIKREAGEIKRAFEGIGSLGGTAYLFSQLRDLVGVFAEVSGLKIAAEFRAVAYSLEAVTGSAQKASHLMRDIRDMANESPFDVQTLASQAGQMIGLGVPDTQVMNEMRILTNALSRSGVSSADAGSVLFNLLQIRATQGAKANFADIRQMLTRAPGMAMILSHGLGVTPDKLVETLRGKSMSGSEVYDALLKGSEALAENAAKLRLLSDPLALLTKTFEQFRQVMEPTGQILLKIGMPVLLLARELIKLIKWLNEMTSGLLGLAALLGGALWLATRSATVSLWNFVKAMVAVAGSSALGARATAIGGAVAGSGIGGIAGGILGAIMARLRTVLALPRLIRASLIGSVVALITEGIAGLIRGDGKNAARNANADTVSRIGTGAAFGTIFGARGALIGAIIGGIYDIYRRTTDGSAPAAAGKNPMVEEQKKTNQLLADLKLTPWGGGKRSARFIADFEADYARRAMFAI